jgi:hypothetical protein
MVGGISEMSKPERVIVVFSGPQGSGKTNTARRTAERHGWECTEWEDRTTFPQGSFCIAGNVDAFDIVSLGYLGIVIIIGCPAEDSYIDNRITSGCIHYGINLGDLK